MTVIYLPSKKEGQRDIGYSMTMVLDTKISNFGSQGWLLLLQNMTYIIAKCDSYFITKCHKSLLQNASGVLLQNTSKLSQNATFINYCSFKFILCK